MQRALPQKTLKKIEPHLIKILKSYNLPQGISQRMKAFLLYQETRSCLKVSAKLGLSHSFICKWNKRVYERLYYWDEQQPSQLKREKLLKAFSDNPRASGPKTYSAEEQCLVIATALKKPSDCQREITHWTHVELADELNKTNTVTGISKSTVGRILREAAIKPHKNQYWLTPNIEDEAQFREEVKTICNLYRDASVLSEKQVHIVSVDEKTGIQALERIHAHKPMKKGMVECIEFEYKRHGTLCLTPSFNIATGKIDAHTIDSTRNEQDFLEHIKKTVAIAPKDDWVFVLDQLNTHKSASLVCWVAKQCNITEPLGEKGKSGVLKDMGSRMDFLTDKAHRIYFNFTPKHCSWLNQVEIWFSILARKLLNRGNFTSLDNLELKLNNFIEYFNLNLAKPFKWTYEGKALRI